jgi:hypothetical protein
VKVVNLIVPGRQVNDRSGPEQCDEVDQRLDT